MLDSMDILRAMEGADRAKVWETGKFLGYTAAEGRASPARRFWRTALLAAVIAAFLGLTAYAVGLSVHQQRQQELRQDLNIEGSGTNSYVEYPVPTEESAPTPGVTVLSAISDGQEQMVYVNVCPVSEEEVEQFPGHHAGVDHEQDRSDTDVAGFVLLPERRLLQIAEGFLFLFFMIRQDNE